MCAKLSWFLAFFALVVICVISHGLDDAVILTPRGYMFETYMYILLGIIVIGMSWLGLGGIRIREGRHLLGLFLVSCVALFGTQLSSSNMVRHVAWTVFMVCMGLLSHVFYEYADAEGTLPVVFMSLVTLVGVLSWMAYTQPLEYESWNKPLVLMLLGLIVVQMIDYCFFFEGYKFVTRFRIYNWISLVIFSGFLLYDTQKLRQNAILISRMCQGKSQRECTNYPAASLGIFLDILNLFSSISNLGGR